MKKMYTLSLMLLSAFAISSQAATLTVNDTSEGTLAILSTSSSMQDNTGIASILWQYEIASNDSGDDAQKSVKSLRSAKTDYLVNCANQTVALSKWEIFSDAEGKGQLIWADQAHGKADFYQPVRRAELSLVNIACEIKTASK